MSNTEEFVNTQPRIKTRKSTKSDMLPMTITLAPIDLTSNNLPLAWKKWLTKLKVYLRANNLEDETDSRKVAILLNFIGSEALEIYYSFGLDLDDLSFDDLCNKFDNYFTPKINITVERHKLFSRKQAPNESIDTYVTDIKNISHSCEFGALREDLLKDIFSWNCNNPYYKERILIEKPKTLDEAINIAKRCEATKQQTKALEDASLHFIGRVSRSPSRREAAIPRSTTRYQRSASNTSNSRNTCDRCGQVHRYKCPAKGTQCRKCKKFNHFVHFCRSKLIKRVQCEETNMLENNNNNSLYVGSIYCIQNNESKPWNVDILINHVNVNFILDTGADTNIISIHTFNTLNMSHDTICRSPNKLSTFSGEVIPLVGQCQLPITYKRQCYTVKFHIVDIKCQNIIGRDTCRSLNLVKKVNSVSFQINCQDIVKSNADLFEGLGCLADFYCELTLKPNATPFIEACRRVPFQLQQPLKQELEAMEQSGVIQRVEEPTEWVDLLVVIFIRPEVVQFSSLELKEGW
ncbi:unnamed protein product, partial [Brenthis ino]